MRGKREVGERRDRGEGEDLSIEDKEVKKEEKVKEQQEKRQLQSVLLSQDDYSSQVTQFGRALRKAVRNTIVKKKEKHNKIIHFKKNKYQSNTNARCKYTL